MAAPLTREERENILWALSCSNGGLTADGVREYIAPWAATVDALVLAFGRFAWHTGVDGRACPAQIIPPEGQCTCGYEAALAALVSFGGDA